MSENNVNGIIGADVATTTGIVGATVAIGQYIVNDYVITIAEAEGDYGYTMTITRGTDTQTVTLYGLTPEQYNAMLGYLEAAQSAAESAAGSASDAYAYLEVAADAANRANSKASSAEQSSNTARSYATQAQTAKQGAETAKTDAQTARTQAQGYRQAAEAAANRAETAAGQITGMTAEAETLTPGSPATASFLDGVLSLGIPAGANGADGNGIVSIVKTGTSGNVDTYTITYTNGSSSTFTVTNGTDGAVTSVAGKTGAVTLDAGDVSFDDQQAYNDGTVGAGLTNLLSQMSANGFPAAAKNALFSLLRQVAYIVDDGQSYYDDLVDSLYPGVQSITAVYTQTSDVFTTTPIDSLKKDLVVTATHTDGTSHIVPALEYTLSGTLVAGDNTVTIIYAGRTTTFNVFVVYALAAPVTMTGVETVDTGIEYEDGYSYSVCVDATLSDVAIQSPVSWVYNNTDNESTYNGVAANRTTDGTSTHWWGAGITYSNALNLFAVGDRMRAVVTLSINSENSTQTVTQTYKNVTKNTGRSRSNSYPNQQILTNATLRAGKPSQTATNNGFVGTLHDFRIYRRLLSTAEIDAYLAGD